MTQEEDVLLEQINELKKKAESLQRVLAVREQRAEELGQIISDREGKVKELDVAIESRREAADQLIVGVTVQVQEMIQALDKQMKLLDVKAERQIKQIGENSEHQKAQLESIESLQKQMNESAGYQGEQLKSVESLQRQMNESAEQQIELLKLMDCRQKQSDENAVQQQEDLKTALRELSEKLDNLKFDFGDRIHTENVKCYRNIKSLFTELDGKLADMELGAGSLEKIQKSFKGWKFFSFFAFADFILIIVYILYSTGLLF